MKKLFGIVAISFVFFSQGSASGEQKIMYCVHDYWSASKLYAGECDMWCMSQHNDYDLKNEIKNGWKIVSAYPKTEVIQEFVPMPPGLPSKGCKCIGTEYILEKD